MRLMVCGARGSTPAPGAEFARYGGHTSCVVFARDGEPPSLILDAGTGIRRVSALLDGAPFRGALLLTHLHWDHVQGLPFFAAGDRPDARVDLSLPAQGEDAEALLARVMSPPHFPVRPRDLRGAWRFSAIAAGRHPIEGFTVSAVEVPHKGGRTLGYRVSDGEVSVAYLPDHAPLARGLGPEGLGAYHDAARALAEGADVLLHDAQHTAAEFPERRYLGHAAMDYAVGLAEACGVGRLLLFHHDPERTDGELDVVAARFRGREGPAIEVAAEGRVIDLRGVSGESSAHPSLTRSRH